MNAIILAGGEAPPDLAAVATWSTATRDRALIEIHGQPVVGLILASLRDSPGIDKIVVVAPETTLVAVRDIAPEVVGIVAGDRMTDNLLAGTRACKQQVGGSTSALICTCDIPLVSPATWTELLDKVAAQGLEAAYPIVSREEIEAAFPGGKRTYAPLTDGTFTGGNAFVLPLHIVPELIGLIDTAFKARKNPLGIARILGMGFVLKALRKKLSIADLEAKMSQVLKCRAGAVRMQDASIAFDIDKAADYEVVRQAFMPRSDQ